MLGRISYEYVWNGANCDDSKQLHICSEDIGEKRRTEYKKKNNELKWFWWQLGMIPQSNSWMQWSWRRRCWRGERTNKQMQHGNYQLLDEHFMCVCTQPHRSPVDGVEPFKRIIRFIFATLDTVWNTLTHRRIDWALQMIYIIQRLRECSTYMRIVLCISLISIIFSLQLRMLTTKLPSSSAEHPSTSSKTIRICIFGNHHHWILHSTN